MNLSLLLLASLASLACCSPVRPEPPSSIANCSKRVSERIRKACTPESNRYFNDRCECPSCDTARVFCSGNPDDATCRKLRLMGYCGLADYDNEALTTATSVGTTAEVSASMAWYWYIPVVIGLLSAALAILFALFKRNNIRKFFVAFSVKCNQRQEQLPQDELRQKQPQAPPLSGSGATQTARPVTIEPTASANEDDPLMPSDPPPPNVPSVEA